MLTPMTDELPDLANAAAEYVASNHSPSGIVAVARHGEVLQTHVWGDDGYDVATPFRVASLTKSFTALALLVLRRAGLLGLDDEVRQHLPELEVEAPADWPALRVRHLLSMAGGLATDNRWGDRQESIDRQTLSAWMASGLRLVFPPGSAFEYSNLGYALLGEIITRVSGQDYRELVRERIIDPLGLGETRFSAGELAAVAPGYHREPMLPGETSAWTLLAPTGPGAFSPIGGLYSSVRDLVAWADLYLRKRPPAGAAFTAADLTEAQQPLNLIATAPADAPLRGLVTQAYGYGLGTEAFSDHGRLIAHSGGYPGYTSYMGWHSESGYTVVASANGSHSGVPAVGRRVMLSLMASVDERPQERPWPETLKAMDALEALAREAAGTASPEELAARYAHVFAGSVEMDFPMARRVEYLRKGLRSVGALRARDEEATVSERPCRARWSVAAELGRLEMSVELVPIAPYTVQTFSVEVVGGDGRVRLF